MHASRHHRLLTQTQLVDDLHHLLGTAKVVHAVDLYGIGQLKGFARIELLTRVTHDVQAPQQVSLTRIYLDPENPRHEKLPDEPSIIKHLISKEKVRALAKSIAEEGGTSPIELIALVQHPKVKTGYVVVEGNRHICALKLLQDPDKAGSEKEKRYFANLAQGMLHAIDKVNAMVFDSRDAARRWFALRHEGEQDGVGTKAWDADQKTRVSVRTQGKNPNAQALLVLDYARQHQLLNAHFQEWR